MAAALFTTFQMIVFIISRNQEESSVQPVRLFNIYIFLKNRQSSLCARLSLLAPSSDAKFLFVALGERVGLLGQLGQNPLQSGQVVLELLLQVLVLSLVLLLGARRRTRGHGGAGGGGGVRAGDFHALLEPFVGRRAPDAPLHVTADGLEQLVVAEHVPVFHVRLEDAHLPVLLQRDVPQQAGHQDGLVHVVHGADEAVHGVEERVLLLGGF